MPSEKPKKKCSIACDFCRKKRIKCDSLSPCGNCQKFSKECRRLQQNQDGRKERHKLTYVRALESQVDLLKRVLYEVKEDPRLLDVLNIDELISQPAIHAAHSHKLINADIPVSQTSPLKVAIVLEDGLKSFETDETIQEKEIISNEVIGSVELQLESKLNDNAQIRQCVDSFFKWLLFDHLFIDEEMFMDEFNNFGGKSDYCTEELIYSIAALGAKVSNCVKIAETGDVYYTIAKKKILLNRINEPSISTIQALLCLSSYDNGYNDKSCWILSGLAFRMLTQLKANQDIHKSSFTNRFFWGCYIYDHQISLILGRSVSIRSKDIGDYQELLTSGEEAGDPNMNNNFVRLTEKESNLDLNIFLMRQLAEITENVIYDVFSSTSNEPDDQYSRLLKLNSRNIELIRWRENVSKYIEWNKKELQFRFDQNFLGFKLHYYILVLSINRPVLTHFKAPQNTELISSKTICEDCVNDLFNALKQFKEHSEGYQTSTSSVVYACILCLSWLVFLNDGKSDLDEHTKVKIELFLGVMDGCQTTWKLAKRAMRLIQTKVDKAWKGLFDGYTLDDDHETSSVNSAQLDNGLSTAQNMFDFDFETVDSVFDQVLKIEKCWESYFPEIFFPVDAANSPEL